MVYEICLTTKTTQGKQSLEMKKGKTGNKDGENQVLIVNFRSLDPVTHEATPTSRLLSYPSQKKVGGRDRNTCQVWWLMPVTPAIWGKKIGGSWLKARPGKMFANQCREENCGPKADPGKIKKKCEAISSNKGNAN
jgi:hypothetical protein